MMMPVFIAMSAALLALHGAPPRLAVALAIAGLALAAGLFLFEIHAPDDGFALPWLRVLNMPHDATRPA